ncbi:hypothetical protein RYZ26_12715 [Terasakiella sp. A23]|uniref:hypothetical protein n=1 Tax=Terasakiella sp. FCG-A23 TaxID=3080561 RepID=UPI002952AA8C|nr:hypothetical protein [Terasakiella sp. A23]MDV7340460.1 hypothetical protein [Terasakiella sp. A23]
MKPSCSLIHANNLILIAATFPILFTELKEATPAEAAGNEKATWLLSYYNSPTYPSF